MFPPTPLSLLCALLLCLPLAAIFTFTTPSTISAVTSGGAAAPPLPNPSSPTNATLIIKRLSTEPQSIKNRTAPADEKDDEDDVSLLSLASRADPSPKPAKKLAFMFLATSSLPLAPLWELYFARAPRSLYNIYVHTDPRVNLTDTLSGVFAGRAVPSKPTRRHSPTLISAARRLLAHALLHDPSNSVFVLLSPSCIPLRSFRFTRRVLMRSRRSFIEILRDEPGARERWAARGEEAMLPEVAFVDFRIGSQFWALRRRHARAVVRDTRLWSKFRLPCREDATCYPEEHYFPTLLNMVDPSGCVPCTLTHVDWKGGHGGHPRTYGADKVGRELLMGLRKSRPRYGDEERGGPNTTVGLRKRADPFLFARKFSPGSLHRLMGIANGLLFKD